MILGENLEMPILDIARSDNLLKKLEEYVTENEAYKDMNKFICCLSENKGFRCTSKVRFFYIHTYQVYLNFESPKILNHDGCTF